jgi:hypothetical protein
MQQTARIFLWCAGLLMVPASMAHAQTATPTAQWQDLSVSLGRLDYDLSGVGHTAGVAVRTTRQFTPHVRLEFRTLFARPCQQFQDCRTTGPATLFAPEAQVQYGWKVGRLQPFVGAGLGTAMMRSSFHTDWDPTMSFGGGTGVRLTDRVGLHTEFRLRGHEWRFTSTTSEISAGVSWHLPAF